MWFFDTIPWIPSALWSLIYNSKETEQLKHSKDLCFKINYPWICRISIQRAWPPGVNMFHLSAESQK